MKRRQNLPPSLHFICNANSSSVKKTVGSTNFYYPFPTYEISGTTAIKYYFFGGQRVAMKSGSTLTYLHGDHLGSTALATTSGGALHSSEQYFAYGKPNRLGAGTNLPTDNTYTGQKSDGSGLMYYNARYYDPQIGLFVSPDTIVPDAGSVFAYNRSMYVYGRVMNANDPSGHQMMCTNDGESEPVNCGGGSAGGGGGAPPVGEDLGGTPSSSSGGGFWNWFRSWFGYGGEESEGTASGGNLSVPTPAAYAVVNGAPVNASELGTQLANQADDLFSELTRGEMAGTTVAVGVVDGETTVAVNSNAPISAVNKVFVAATANGWKTVPNVRGIAKQPGHAEQVLYDYSNGNIETIGVSHVTGPCSPCRDAFTGTGVEITYTGEYKTSR